jgi:hypothetical protein
MQPGRGLGSIQGHLIADSAGVLLHRGVFVNRYACETVAESDGRYVITGLPPGTYRITVGNLGARQPRPASVRVGADSTSTLDIHLTPENLALDCLEDAACRDVTAPLDAARRRLLSDSEQVLEIVARTTVGLAALATKWSARRPGALCIAFEDSTEAGTPLPRPVLAAVLARVPIARSRTDCASRGGNPAGLLRTPDGLWAWRLLIAVKRGRVSGAVAYTSYHVGGTWAQGWLCRFGRTAQGWRPVECHSTWVS